MPILHTVLCTPCYQCIRISYFTPYSRSSQSGPKARVKAGLSNMAAYPIITMTGHFPETTSISPWTLTVVSRPFFSLCSYSVFNRIRSAPPVGPGSDKKTARRQQSVNPDDGNNLKPFFSSLPFPFSLLLFFPSSLQFSSYVPWLFCLSLLSFDASLRSIAL